MAAELVDNPTAIHTGEHDAELVFWVLLWLYLLYMKTDVQPGTRSSVLDGIMNPLVFNGTGGMAKATFMEGLYGLKRLETPGSIIFRLLTKLRQIIGRCYQTNNADGDATDKGAKNKGATMDIQGDVLALLKEFAESEEWPSNDCTELQEVVSYERASTCWSRSKRSLAKLNGTIETLPPAKRLRSEEHTSELQSP